MASADLTSLHSSSPERRLFLFINLAHMLTHYALLILPTAVLVMALPGGAFGADYGQILALATGMFVLFGVGSLPQGWLAQRVGSKVLMTAFFFGGGASLLWAGLSAGPLGLALALSAVGLFTSIYHPIGLAMLVNIAGDKPGRAIGRNGVAGNVGVAFAPVVTALLAHGVGWRAAFLLPGAVFLLCGVLWLGVEAPEHRIKAGARPFPPIPRALVRQAVTVLLLIAVVSGLVFNAFTLLLPKLLQERLATSPALLPLVGAAAFGVTLCGALTQFSVGQMIDRTTLRRVFLPLGVALAPALLLLAFLDGWAVLPVAAIVAAVLFGQVMVNETMTARYISPELRARMYSVRFFVGFLGSAGAAPLVAVLQDRTGTSTAAMLVMAAFALITLGCALLFPNRREELQPELWAEAGAMPLPAE